LIKTDKTERSKGIEDGGSQGYRHFLQLQWRQNYRVTDALN